MGLAAYIYFPIIFVMAKFFAWTNEELNERTHILKEVHLILSWYLSASNM